MAEADRIAAALRYQQELDAAQRPATMNPNIAAQGVGSRNRLASALASQSGNWSSEALPMEGRAAFLPFQDTLPGSVMNKRSLALPGIVAGAVNAITAPGRALSGSDPNFDPQEEAANFAMNVMGGGIGASRLAPVPAGSLGMNVVAKRAFTAPQDEALRQAQQRAALPVEQGGLGLPASNTPQQRAAAMGGEDVYHGTTAKKQILNDLKFNLEKDQRQVGGIWTTKDKNYATWLADKKNKDLANVMQLKLLNAKNSDEFDILKEAIKIADEINAPKPKNALEAQELLSGGYGWDRVVADLLNESKTPNLKITNFNDAYHSNPNEVTSAFVTKDPSLFRLPNAAFDPFRRNAALATALGVAAPDLLAEEKK